MPEKYVIREVPATRFTGVVKAAKALHISQNHLAMCLRGERTLSKERAARLTIIRLKEAPHGAGVGA